MNGAIAEPCVNTISAPNSAIIVRIGRSQNFLRTRMKAHISATNESMIPSELVFHGFGCRSRGYSDDPIARRLRVALAAQRVFLRGAQHEADRRHDDEEEHAQRKRAYHLREEQSQLRPQSVERRKQAGPKQRGRDKERRAEEPPRPRRAATPEIL